MGFRIVQKSMTLIILNGQNAYAVTGNQNVICYGCNVRFMLVLLTYLFYKPCMLFRPTSVLLAKQHRDILHVRIKQSRIVKKRHQLCNLQAHIIHRVRKKGATLFSTITLAFLSRFLKRLHQWKQE